MWPFTRRLSSKRHFLSDDDRDASIETRKAISNARARDIIREQERRDLKWEVERQELLARIDDVKASYEEEDSGGADAMLLQLLGLTGQPPAPVVPTGTATHAPAAQRLTDEEIMNVIDSFDKKAVKIASRMPEQLLLSQLRAKVPGYDEDTYARAVRIVKTGR